MPFTPLVPLPEGNGEPMLDPFEELLRPSSSSTPASSSSSKPIFPPHVTSTRRSATQPITIPNSAAPVAALSDDASTSLGESVVTPSSANSDFGAFVSVDPSQDPLSAAFSPPKEFTSVPSQIANDAFVEEAKRRSEHDGKRIMDEFLLFEQNPSSLMKLSMPLSPVPPSAIATPSDGSQFAAFEQEFEELVRTDPPQALPESLPSNDTDYPVVPASSDFFPESMETGTATPTMSQTPDTFNSQAGTPMPEDRTSIHDSAPSSISSSFTSYLSGTLPRKWSTLLRSPSSSALHAHQSPPLPSHAASMPAPSSSPTASISSITVALLTHDSPFAAQPFIPPSGAPGFGGDRNWDKGFDFSPEQKVGQPVDLVGRNETARQVLSSKTAQLIRPSLPPLFRLAKKWTLLYSLDQHGISLATFYSRVSPHCAVGGCLLVLRDADDHTFGVWMGDGIRKSTSIGAGRGYYGSGESFLWKQENDGASVRVFKWTGKNDYVALCESDYISFGGGDGRYGLFLDSSLYDGSTAPCPTFDNEPLSGSSGSNGTVRFECVGLEVWGVLR